MGRQRFFSNNTSEDKIGLKVHTIGNGGSGRSKESLLCGEGSQGWNSRTWRNPWGSVAHWLAFWLSWPAFSREFL